MVTCSWLVRSVWNDRSVSGKRPKGATVEEIAAVTGWQHHTIRGAISGALKKKLGLTVEATRTREVGPNKTGAKGSSTVYWITDSPPAAD